MKSLVYALDKATKFVKECKYSWILFGLLAILSMIPANYKLVNVYGLKTSPQAIAAYLLEIYLITILVMLVFYGCKNFEQILKNSLSNYVRILYTGAAVLFVYVLVWILAGSLSFSLAPYMVEYMPIFYLATILIATVVVSRLFLFYCYIIAENEGIKALLRSWKDTREVWVEVAIVLIAAMYLASKTPAPIAGIIYALMWVVCAYIYQCEFECRRGGEQQK